MAVPPKMGQSPPPNGAVPKKIRVLPPKVGERFLNLRNTSIKANSRIVRLNILKYSHTDNNRRHRERTENENDN